MLTAATCSIAIRSYGAQSTVDRHDFAQLVLPLAGELSMDIAGREARLDRTLAAYVDAGSRHDQVSEVSNRSLILDLHTRDLDMRTADRLSSRRYLPVTPEATHLIDYMGASLSQGRMPTHKLTLWVPLVVDALLGQEPQLPARLASLLTAVETDLSKPWTVDSMAEKAGVSASRLHAIFQESLGKSPRAWLMDLRLEQVCRWLTHTDLAIAELTYRSGYADQSALTRALRKATGFTPAAYRRQTRAQD